MAALMVAAAAWLIGAFPTGVVLSSMVHRRDVRRFGSGNPGAVNIWRVFGPKLGGVVVFVDLLKGFAAAEYLPHWVVVTEPQLWAATLGLMAIMGHIWSPFLGFKGGKGVATAFGAALALYPIAALVCAGVWIAVVWFSRYACLGSLTSCAIYPAAVYWSADPEPAELAIGLVIPFLLIYTHRGNIRRLMNGEELKVGHQSSLTE